MTSQVTPKGATEAVRSVTGHKDDWPWRRPCTLFPHSLVFGCILAFEFLVTVTSYHRSHTESCVWFHLLCVRSPSRRRPRLIVLSSHPTIASPILSFPPFPPFNTSFPSLSRALMGLPLSLGVMHQHRLSDALRGTVVRGSCFAPIWFCAVYRANPHTK